MKNSLEIKYGIAFALIVVAYVILEHFLGLNTTNHAVGEYSRFGGVLVPILGILFGLIAKRRELGWMTIGQGVKSGFIIALAQTTLTTIWFLIYPNLINPEFYSTMFAHEAQKLAAQGLAPSEIEASLTMLRWMFSFPVQPIFQMLFGVAYGVFFAIVFSGSYGESPAATLLCLNISVKLSSSIALNTRRPNVQYAQDRGIDQRGNDPETQR